MSDTDYGITVNITNEEDAIITDNLNEEYDGNIIICTINIPYDYNEGVLHIFNGEENIKNITITYDDSLTYSLNNDWRYNVRLEEVDFTRIMEDDYLSFTFSVNDNIIYETNVTAHRISDKLYFNNFRSDDTNISNDIRATNDKLFQARVFIEKDKNVYGAEIILFDNNDEEINRILITDDTQYEAMYNFLENMKQSYVPYTTHDVEIVDILSNNDEDSDEYIQANSEWSDLSKKKDLKSILENDLIMSDTDKTSYTNSGKILINATHLNGYDSSNFSKEGHTHDNLYLTPNHSNIVGVNGNLGHLRLVDNLTTEEISGGQVLSANQGRILNERLNTTENKFQWTFHKYNNYVSYYLNKDLHLIVLNYHREEYDGFKNTTGEKILHKGFPYQPSEQAITSLYRGDMSLYIKTNGDICIYSLTKLANKDILAQLMYHYK